MLRKHKNKPLRQLLYVEVAYKTARFDYRFRSRSRAETDVGITTEDEYAVTPHNISSIVMTLILVRDHTASRCVPLMTTGRFIRLLVHPALSALTSSMSYSGKATLFERTHIS
jgi:hypothetical protein